MILISILLANKYKQSVDDVVCPNTLLLIIVNSVQLQLVIKNMIIYINTTFDTQISVRSFFYKIKKMK